MGFLKLLKKIIRVIVAIFNILLFVLLKNFRSSTKSKKYLIVKFGRLGDQYIFLRVLQGVSARLNVSELSVAVPINFHSIFSEKFVDLELIPLPDPRANDIFDFLHFMREVKRRKITHTLMLGGSRSPVEEDLIAACLAFTEVHGFASDLSKSDKLAAIMQDFVYRKVEAAPINLEYDILRYQVDQFFNLKSPKRSKAIIKPNKSELHSVLVFPAASSINRCWTQDTLICVVDQTKEVLNPRSITVCGDPSFEFAYANALAAISRHEHVSTKFQILSFQELEKLIDSADLVVCNDSAPLHIAQQLGVPVIILAGQGHYKRFADYQVPLISSMECANCLWKCHLPLGDDLRFQCMHHLSREINSYLFGKSIKRTS